MNSRITAFAFLAVAACGPEGRRGDNGNGFTDANDNPGGDEVCNDDIDNDADGLTDCSDPQCAGIDGCPACGEVENPEVQPLALPDGIGTGAACTTDAQCTTAGAPNCVAKECHDSYASTLNFIGFPAGSTLTDPLKLKKVCVNMEHSWLHDLQMELLTPDGGVFILHKFVDRTGGPTYLGGYNDSDSASNPVPGTGFEYCWTPEGAQTMLEAAGSGVTLPAGDYGTDSPWNSLSGATLNGEWTMRVTDLWGIDNGYLFGWKIEFDPTLVEDCAGPIIL